MSTYFVTEFSKQPAAARLCQGAIILRLKCLALAILGDLKVATYILLQAALDLVCLLLQATHILESCNLYIDL